MRPGYYFTDSEMDVHLRVVAWLRERPHLLWCHVPNGAASAAMGARQRRMGALAGMPDLLIFSRPQRLPDKVGTAIELKRKHGGVLAIHQGVCINRLAREGWHVIVAQGYDAAILHLRAAGY